MRTLQTPRPASPPAAPVTAPAGQTQGTVNLAQQLADLRIQEAGLAAQKNSLRLQLEGMRVDNPARPPVQAKDAEVGVQLAQVRGDIARIQAQLQGQGIRTIPPTPPRRQFDPDLAAGLMFAFIFAVLMPMSIAMARRVWRGRPSTTATDPTIAPRLDRLEHAIDAVAIEVERVSEGQRFVTKILAERPASAPATAPASAEAAHGDYGSAMRALGAGAAEPIAMPEREAVRQRNTPR